MALGKKNPTLEQMVKDGIVRLGNDPALQIVRISSGLEGLDYLLGGGIPKGKIIELYGPESTGKTLIAQTIAAAVQKTDLPGVVYFDMEDSYDQIWWQQSNVDIDRMLVTSPATAEEATNIMVALLQAKDMKLGLIIIDSIAGMVPAIDQDPERGAEEHSMGAQAKAITRMFHKTKSLLGDTILLLTNQMRSTVGQAWTDEIDALPGGKANRHYCHAILRTRRDGWIKEGDTRIGFPIEIINRKNKLANTADGESIKVPYTFKGQIDFLMSYIEEGLEKEVITKAGPYFRFGEHQWLGKSAMRAAMQEDSQLSESLKIAVTSIPSIAE